MISTNGTDSSAVAPAAVTPKLRVTMDAKGRVRTSKEQRRAILTEFERSGVSVTQFARRNGLKYSTFAAWVQRYRRPKRATLKSPVRLLEAVVTPTPLNSPSLHVQLPGGARLEFREASQVPLVAALVRALEKPC
jgi:transposase-like protein